MKVLILGILSAMLLPSPVLASTPRPSSDPNTCVRNVFVWEAETHGYSVTFGEPLFNTIGSTSSDGVVIVSDRLDPDTQLYVELHELAHVMLGHQERGGAARLPYDQKEREAATATAMTIDALHLPYGEINPVEYVLAYSRSSRVIRTYETVLIANSMASRLRTYCHL